MGLQLDRHVVAHRIGVGAHGQLRLFGDGGGTGIAYQRGRGTDLGTELIGLQGEDEQREGDAALHPAPLLAGAHHLEGHADVHAQGLHLLGMDSQHIGVGGIGQDQGTVAVHAPGVLPREQGREAYEVLRGPIGVRAVAGGRERGGEEGDGVGVDAADPSIAVEHVFPMFGEATVEIEEGMEGEVRVQFGVQGHGGTGEIGCHRGACRANRRVGELPTAEPGCSEVPGGVRAARPGITDREGGIDHQLVAHVQDHLRNGGLRENAGGSEEEKWGKGAVHGVGVAGNVVMRVRKRTRSVDPSGRHFRIVPQQRVVDPRDDGTGAWVKILRSIRSACDTLRYRVFR